jgi:hypothetical protein
MLIRRCTNHHEGGALLCQWAALIPTSRYLSIQENNFLENAFKM